MVDTSGTGDELLGERAWAGELFITADALLSGMKQLHVEGEEELALFAGDDCNERLTHLDERHFEATCRLTRLIVEETVDGLSFFALVWISLFGGGPVVASAARILVSANNWTPSKRKRYSPYRSIDAWIERQMNSQIQYSDVVSEAWHQEVQEWQNIYQDVVGTRQNALANMSFDKVWDRPGQTQATAICDNWERRIQDDMRLVYREFAVQSCSPTEQGIRNVLRGKPEMALLLANIYRKYARTAGFGKLK